MTIRSSSAVSPARRRRALRRPGPERPPAVPMVPAVTDEVLRHPLEVVDVIPVPGPARDPVPDLCFNRLQKRVDVPSGPRRGHSAEDRGDVAVDSALHEDLPVPELELLQILVLLAEGIPHEQHDPG